MAMKCGIIYVPKIRRKMKESKNKDSDGMFHGFLDMVTTLLQKKSQETDDVKVENIIAVPKKKTSPKKKTTTTTTKSKPKAK